MLPLARHLRRPCWPAMARNAQQLVRAGRRLPRQRTRNMARSSEGSYGSGGAPWPAACALRRSRRRRALRSAGERSPSWESAAWWCCTVAPTAGSMASRKASCTRPRPPLTHAAACCSRQVPAAHRLRISQRACMLSLGLRRRLRRAEACARVSGAPAQEGGGSGGARPAPAAAAAPLGAA